MCIIIQTVLQDLPVSDRHWALTTQSHVTKKINYAEWQKYVNSIDIFNVSFNFFHTKTFVTRIDEEEQGLPRRTKSFSHTTVNFKAL